VLEFGDMTSWRQVQTRFNEEQDGEHIPYDQRYWTAQVCLAGHVQNGGVRVIPAEKFCECGEETIHECPACHSNIKGAYRSYGDWIKKPPMGCLKCGTQYPWATTAVEKVSQIIDDSPLSTLEKEEAKTDLDSIIKNKPDAETAAQRTHARLKVSGALRTAYLDYVVPLISETLAKIFKTQ
jgi:hypothetical protein